MLFTSADMLPYLPVHENAPVFTAALVVWELALLSASRHPWLCLCILWSPPLLASEWAVAPPAVPVPAPIAVRPRRSGTLNVVDPSPAPQAVPRAANKAA